MKACGWVVRAAVLVVALAGEVWAANVDLAIENLTYTRGNDYDSRRFTMFRYEIVNKGTLLFASRVRVDYHLSHSGVNLEALIGYNFHDLYLNPGQRVVINLDSNQLWQVGRQWQADTQQAGLFLFPFAHLVVLPPDVDVATADNRIRGESFMYHHRRDIYEPDNDYHSAKKIGRVDTQQRSLHTAWDRDVAYFTIGSTGASNVTIETAGETGDTVMRLYKLSPSYWQLAYDDDSGIGNFSKIEQAYLAPGKYYIEIKAYNLRAGIRSYQLRVRWSTEFQDAFEPDNSARQAKPLYRGQIQERSLHNKNDEDWVKLTLGSGGGANLILQTSGRTVNSIGDTEMWLYNANMIPVAYDNDGGRERFSKITRSRLGPGIYYLRIRARNHYGAIRYYRLWASWQ